MNAAIRAVVRTAIYHKLDVIGIKRGYQGLIEGDLIPLGLESVGGIINQGGTFLRSARSMEFKTREGQQKAVLNLKKFGVEGLVIIGGDGSFHGADVLNSEWHIPTIGIPGSIDNDISGTDFTIGYDTAVNTGLDAVDKIRDTAYSHDRIFVIEVMGRSNGFVAMAVGLAGGAESILIPEVPFSLDKIADRLKEGYHRGKRSDIVIVAEGAARASDVAAKLHELTGFDTRETVLGHVQRGGSPTANDRILASRMGEASVNFLLEGQAGVMVGIVDQKVVSSPIRNAWEIPVKIDMSLYHLAELLSI